MTSSATTKLRSDLVLSRQETEGSVRLVVKNPQSGRYFRFGEVEGFVLEQLTSAADAETIRQKVEARFNAPLAQSTLDRFIERLGGLGLLDTAALTAPAAPRRRVAGDLFYLRFKAFDPDCLFNWLLPKVRCLFTPHFVALSAALVVVAVDISVVHWTEITRQLGGLFHFESLLVAWLVLLGVVTLHEFAHGLTCKHFGGSVRELGFLLIYLQPAFYCNVSDAWLFPEKSKRLWVTAAGAHFELFLWALATLVWRVTDPATTLNYLALVVVVTSGIKTQFNLNPLIKLDGYYLLSDWLDVPNLRRRAFAYLRARVTSAFGQTVEWLKTTTPRERWIYLIYGLLAGTYSFWLFGFIAGWLFGFLVEQYQAWGFAFFVALLLGVFRAPVRRSITLVNNQVTSPRGWVRGLKRTAKLLAALA